MLNTKKDMINGIAAELECTKVHARKVYDVVCSLAKQTLLDSGEYALPGFGTIKVVTRNARTARNPRTGEEVDVPAKKTIVLKASTSAKESVN